MQDNRCPNCQNDISDAITAAIVDMLQSDGETTRPMACPHCDEALTVTARVSTTLAQQQAGSR